MANGKGSALDRLSTLVSKGRPIAEDGVGEQEQDARLEETARAVLDVVAKLPGIDGDLFLMQEVVETCAGMLQADIRDLFEGGEDGEG